MIQFAGFQALRFSFAAISPQTPPVEIQRVFAGFLFIIFLLGLSQGIRFAGQILIYCGLFALLSMSQAGPEFLLPGIASLAMGVGILVYQKELRSSLTAPYLIMMALGLPIAIYSGGSGSAKGWSSWFEQFGITPAQADAIIWILRKFIHVTYYGSLAWTAYRYALCEKKKLATYALCVGIVWCACHAGFDELRQSVTPDRSGSIIDFGIDLSGALLFLGLARFRSHGGANSGSSAT